MFFLFSNLAVSHGTAALAWFQTSARCLLGLCGLWSNTIAWKDSVHWLLS